MSLNTEPIKNNGDKEFIKGLAEQLFDNLDDFNSVEVFENYLVVSYNQGMKKND